MIIASLLFVSTCNLRNGHCNSAFFPVICSTLSVLLTFFFPIKNTNFPPLAVDPNLIQKHRFRFCCLLDQTLNNIILAPTKHVLLEKRFILNKQNLNRNSEQNLKVNLFQGSRREISIIGFVSV